MAATDMPTSLRSPAVAVLDTIDGAVGALCRAVVLSTGVALLVLITIGVTSRYVLSVGGVDWAEELPKLIFAWFIMGGVVLAVQGGNHIAVDLVMRSLTMRGKAFLLVATNLLIAGAYVWLGITSLEVAEIASMEINPILGTPGSLVYYAMAAGSALTALSTLSIAVRVFVLGAEAAPQGKPEDSVQ